MSYEGTKIVALLREYFKTSQFLCLSFRETPSLQFWKESSGAMAWVVRSNGLVLRP